MSSIFHALPGVDGAARYEPTEQARGPWDPGALHGGAPAALLTSIFEQHGADAGGDDRPPPGLRIARLGFEFLRPVPFAPLRVELRTIRPGRRVQELAAELYADAGRGEEQLVCRADALRVSEVPPGLPPLPEGAVALTSMPGPEQAEPIVFGLNPDVEQQSFAASAIEMRCFEDLFAPGPGRVWQRLRHALVDDAQPSPLARLAASADFGNGISASLPFDSWLFINADLHIHLHRQPRGEWIGLDARTLLNEGGMGLSESVLHDADGPVGRAFQTLVVAPR